MATTIRLTRMGRKQAPFYRIVVCDSRTRRDGDYIESLGYYNPMPDAYQLEVDHGKTIAWLDKGAQPTDTAKSLLRSEGVLYRWHLIKGGSEADKVEAEVEQFRARRVSASEKIKAGTAAKLKSAQDAREVAAKKVQKEKAAAEAAAAAPAEAAADEATETTEADTASVEESAVEVAAEESAAKEPAAKEPATEASADKPDKETS